MKKFVAISLLLIMTLAVSAQDNKRFSPEKFEADLRCYITKEASLTPQEADKFFPIFREMREKQRAIYDKMRKMGMNKPADEEACKRALLEYDQLNLELRQLDVTYHKKMLKVIPASKVYAVMNAENGFHRQMMKGWQRGWQKGWQKGKQR
jgi:hypothetical protein